MTIKPVQKSGNIDQLVARIHEIEVKDVFLVGHVRNVATERNILKE